MKKNTVLFLCVLVVLLCGTVLGSAATLDKVDVTIDGKAIKFQDAMPFVDSSHRTQIPLRLIGESLGYGVLWDAKTESALLFKVDESGKSAECSRFYIGKSGVELMVAKGKKLSTEDSLEEFTAKVTGYEQQGILTMDTVAVIKERRTYIPVRYVAELFGNTVEWDNGSRTVIIKTKGGEAAPVSTNVSRGTDRITTSESAVFIGMRDGGYYFNQSCIPSGGCVLTCIAMITSNMQDQEVTPVQVYEVNGSTVYFQWSIEPTLELKRAKYIVFEEDQNGAERRKTAIETLKSCPQGTMLSFTNSTGNHSLVFTGYDSETDTVYVNDPAGGENVPFVESYTGARMFAGDEDDGFAHLVKIYAYN